MTAYDELMAEYRYAKETEVHDPAEAAKKKQQYELLEHNLTNHKPGSAMIEMKMERLRADAKQLGISILSNCPESRERSLAQTNLEQAVMWAIAALARNQ